MLKRPNIKTRTFRTTSRQSIEIARDHTRDCTQAGINRRAARIQMKVCSWRDKIWISKNRGAIKSWKLEGGLSKPQIVADDANVARKITIAATRTECRT